MVIRGGDKRKRVFQQSAGSRIPDSKAQIAKSNPNMYVCVCIGRDGRTGKGKYREDGRRSGKDEVVEYISTMRFGGG